MDENQLERRLTRVAALRLGATGAAGLALGVRPARAAPTDGAAVEAAARAFLASLSPARRDRATFPFGSEERTRWHWTVPSSVPRNGLPLGVVSAEQRRLAFASAAGEYLSCRLPQGARHHGAPGCPATPRHGHQRSVRSRSVLRLGLRHSRRPRLGLAVRRASPLQALHRRRGHRRRRAVLPRRVADPCDKRLSLGREGRPDDAARGGRRARDRALARPRAPEAGRVLVGVADRSHHTERRPGEPARTGRRPHRAISRQERSDGSTRSSARTSRTTRRRSSERRSRGSHGPDSSGFASAGPAARSPACRTTTGSRARPSCSSSTTRGTAAPTSTASGATSSATSGGTCSSDAVGIRLGGPLASERPGDVSFTTRASPNRDGDRRRRTSSASGARPPWRRAG